MNANTATLVVTEIVNAGAKKRQDRARIQSEEQKPSYAPVVGKKGVLSQKPALLYERPIISKGYRNGSEINH